MSHYTAQQTLAALSGQPSYIEDRYVAGEESLISLSAQIHQLANALPDREEAAWDRRKAEIAGAYGATPTRMDSKSFVFFDGVAVIPIHGMLINRFPHSWGYVTGYSFIRAQVAAAQDDPDVERIIYDVNTYGGLVAGCAETAEMMYASRAKKPSLAMIDAHCYSAGYFLASAASKVAITQSGGAGSIGVVAMRMDVTAMLEKVGWKVHLIYAGARKVDSYSVTPMTEEAEKRIKASVDRSYASFTGAVAKYRRMDEKAVRATEAACYDAEEALALGLVDRVLPATEALLAADIWDQSGLEARKENEEMPDPAAAAPETPAASAPVPNVAQVAADAATAERGRIAAIQGAAAAKDRPKLAAHLALNTAMSAADATEIMQAAASETAPPAPAPAAAASALDAAMDRTPQPNISPGAGNGQDGEPTAAQRILAAQRLATGEKAPTTH